MKLEVLICYGDGRQEIEHRDVPDDYFVEIKSSQQKIAELKQTIAASDYKALKYAEGFIAEADYAPIKAARQALRDEINRLEANL